MRKLLLRCDSSGLLSFSLKSHAGAFVSYLCPFIPVTRKTNNAGFLVTSPIFRSSSCPGLPPPWLGVILVQFAEFLPEEQTENSMWSKPKIGRPQAFVESGQALFPHCLREAVHVSPVELALNRGRHTFI